jgi:hypothetical protein
MSLLRLEKGSLKLKIERLYPKCPYQPKQMSTDTPLNNSTPNKYLQYATLVYQYHYSVQSPSVADIIPLVIDELPVNLCIYVGSDRHNFSIDSRKIKINEYEDETITLFNRGYYKHTESESKFLTRHTPDTFTIEELADFMKNVHDFIAQLKFDKYVGKFTPDKFSKVELAKAAKELFTDMMEDLPTCCVCHDPTETKTICNHSLCIICWEQLKQMTCPICREAISYMYSYDHDEE